MLATLPRPLAAGLGLIVSLPEVLSSLPQRLLARAAEVHAGYDQLAARGRQVLGQDTSDGTVAVDGQELFGAEEVARENSLFDGTTPDVAADVAADAGAPAALTDDESVGAQALIAAVADRDQAPPVAVEHAALPLPDYDHLTLGSLRSRLRRLSAADLAVLRDYEAAHARRLPVLSLLENRIAKLIAESASTTPG